MEIGRRIFDPAQRKCFDWPIRTGHPSMNHPRLKKPLHLQVVHRIVRVIRRSMTAHALCLANEQRLSPAFRDCGLLQI